MTEQNIEPSEPNTETETSDDELLTLPPERLVAMLRDKRKAEATVRGKLRDAEAGIEKLTGSVNGYQRQAFSAAAKDHRVISTAMEDVLANVNLAGLLGEDGTIDPAKVGPALAELQKTKPHYFRIQAVSSVDTSGGGGEPYRPQTTWGDVLR